MNTIPIELAPKLDELGRWYWPDPDCECVRMMRRAGRFRVVLTIWLEEQIANFVELLTMPKKLPVKGTSQGTFET